MLGAEEGLIGFCVGYCLGAISMGCYIKFGCCCVC